MSTPHNHTVDVYTFAGTHQNPHEAVRIAADKMRDWYATQRILFSVDGASVFSFSTSVMPDVDFYGQPAYVAMITVVDPREDKQ